MYEKKDRKNRLLKKKRVQQSRRFECIIFFLVHQTNEWQTQMRTQKDSIAMAVDTYNETSTCMRKSCKFFCCPEARIRTEFTTMEISLHFAKTIIIEMEYAQDYFQFLFYI